MVVLPSWPPAWPAVVWIFKTEMRLPSGPSSSTMRKPRWMALHSNQACLEKEEYSLLTGLSKTMERIGKPYHKTALPALHLEHS